MISNRQSSWNVPSRVFQFTSRAVGAVGGVLGQCATAVDNKWPGNPLRISEQNAADEAKKKLDIESRKTAAQPTMMSMMKIATEVQPSASGTVVSHLMEPAAMPLLIDNAVSVSPPASSSPTSLSIDPSIVQMLRSPEKSGVTVSAAAFGDNLQYALVSVIRGEEAEAQFYVHEMPHGLSGYQGYSDFFYDTRTRQLTPRQNGGALNFTVWRYTEKRLQRSDLEKQQAPSFLPGHRIYQIYYYVSASFTVRSLDVDLFVQTELQLNGDMGAERWSKLIIEKLEWARKQGRSCYIHWRGAYSRHVPTANIPSAWQTFTTYLTNPTTVADTKK